MAARRNRNSSKYLGRLTLVDLDRAADPEPAAPTLEKGWKFYGCDDERPAYVTSEETGPRPVWMTRKGQRVRFVAVNGEQVGPEQANVAPACCFAAAHGWIDPTNPTLSVMCTLEVRGQLR